MSESFCLVTTPRYDPELMKVSGRGLFAGWHYDEKSPLYMFNYHHQRLLKGATHLGWKLAVDSLTEDSSLEQLSLNLRGFIGENQQSPLRLRVLLSDDGIIKFEKYDTPTTPLENLLPERLPPPGTTEAHPNDPRREVQYVVVVDTQGTANSEHTYFKTTQRPVYDAARLRAALKPTDQKEVLLLNETRDFVTEGSITTPYFWRQGRWVTPPVPQDFRQDAKGGQWGTTRRWALER